MHMAVVASDAETFYEEYRDFDYAVPILRLLKECLLKHFQQRVRLGQVPLDRQTACESE